MFYEIPASLPGELDELEALIESLLRLSQLMVDFPEIDGIDINPVMAREKGAIAVDARISLAKK